MRDAFRRFLIIIALIVSSLLFTWILGESILRIYDMFKHDIPFINLRTTTTKKRQNRLINPAAEDITSGEKTRTKSVRPLTLDKKLGWRSSPNYIYVGEKFDSSFKKYAVKIQTDNYGFRMFGDPGTAKMKVFFIGDSYTQALEVSNDKTYYAVAGAKLGVEVFAYGAGGYGSLQEYMILDEFLDIIKPDIIVWQFCQNDFINNDYELERLSYLNSLGILKPFLNLKGEIIYRNPGHFNLADSIFRKSRLIKLIDQRLKKLLAVIGEKKTIENKIRENGNSLEEFRRSIKITKMIMRMVKARASKVPVYAFSVDDEPLYYNTFKEICDQCGLRFIDGLPQSIHAAEEKGFITRYADGDHWSELGNSIAAERIIECFEQEGIVRSEVNRRAER